MTKLCSVAPCSKPSHAGGMCSMHYSRVQRHNSIADPVRLPFAERFWAKVDRSAGPGGCWPWTGAINRNGYGVFGETAGRQQVAHRVAYQLAVGDIPEDLQIDHTCHGADPHCRKGSTCPHRACTNPAHLEPVTPRINVLRSRSLPAANAAKAVCLHGHPLTGCNLYTAANGSRKCRACNRERNRAYKLRRRLGKTA